LDRALDLLGVEQPGDSPGTTIKNVLNLAAHPSLGTMAIHKASLPDVALDTNIFASEAFLSILSCDHRLRLREVPFVTVPGLDVTR
jgi:hypothetical protein